MSARMAISSGVTPVHVQADPGGPRGHGRGLVEQLRSPARW